MSWMLAVLLLAAPLAPGTAAPTELAQNVAVSRDQAAAIARSTTGGRVLSVDYQARDGGSWRVKVLLSNRRVRTVVVDARNGSVRG